MLYSFQYRITCSIDQELLALINSLKSIFICANYTALLASLLLTTYRGSQQFRIVSTRACFIITPFVDIPNHINYVCLYVELLNV